MWFESRNHLAKASCVDPGHKNINYLAGPGGLFRTSMYSTLRAALRITSCNSPFRLTFGHSNLLQANLVVRSNSLPANLYSGHPALRPSGQPSAVQIRSRRICRTSYRFSSVHLSAVNAHIHQRLYLAGPGGFEPPNARIKTWCLTAWRRPNISKLAGALPRH
jgi:hypothetical protein